MSNHLKARDAADVAEAVAWALAGGKTIDVVGHGSKRGVGRAAAWDLTLDLSGLCGVTLYEPEELVLSAQAGTPLSQIAALTAEKGQELAFEPMDYGPIFGRAPGSGTIGGVLASNQSGPRRIKAGAARDHFLGFHAISGRGETFKSGGRVVKNVTGYDLCKLMAGSWGTLAVMTEVTLKVLPRSQTEQTILVHGLDDGTAAKAMAAAMGSAGEISGAAHLPAGIVKPMSALAAAGSAVTALRVEGVAPSVAHRKAMLETLMKPLGPLAVLDEAASRSLWTSLRDVVPFASNDADPKPLWRISTAPMNGHVVAARIMAEAAAEVFYDWAGGLIWCMLEDTANAHAGLMHRLVASLGGHATLIRAGETLRASVEVFEPQLPAVAGLTRRVKHSFDPNAVLGRGRMYADL